MKKINTFLKNNLGIVLIVILSIFLLIQMLQGCNKQPTEDDALIEVQSKIDSIYTKLDQEKNNKIDTLIIEQNHEKEIVKKLQAINHYYTQQDNNIDTILIVDSTLRSPFAASKLQEWKLRSDTGYYDIPK